MRKKDSRLLKNSSTNNRDNRKTGKKHKIFWLPAKDHRVNLTNILI